MKALPAQDEISELSRLAGDDLLAQESQAAALHLLGRTAALYPASWSGWVSQETRPVATGA